jgi:segregation and condensation protein B
VLKSLLDMGLLRVVGRANALGRPLLYGTTQKFLITFGLKSPKDLPSIEDLKAGEQA